MSELKGQLLGMILVLGIFGIIAGTLIPAFQNTAERLESEMDVNLSSQVSSRLIQVNIQ